MLQSSLSTFIAIFSLILAMGTTANAGPTDPAKSKKKASAQTKKSASKKPTSKKPSQKKQPTKKGQNSKKPKLQPPAVQNAAQALGETAFCEGAYLGSGSTATINTSLIPLPPALPAHLEMPNFTEVTVIHEVGSKPGDRYLYSEHVLNYANWRTGRGDETRIDFVLQGRKLNQRSLTDNSSYSNSNQLSRISNEVSNQNHALNTRVSMSSYGLPERIEIAKKYLKLKDPEFETKTNMTQSYLIKQYSEMESLFDTAFKEVVRMENKAAGLTAWDTGPRIGITLTNYDQNRYIRFVPTGYSELVPARILHIHSIEYPQGTYQYTVMAEYIGNEITQGQRVRHITELTLAEMQTIHLAPTGDVEELFESTLTPISIATKNHAEKLGLKLYSYSTREEGSSFNISALDMMSNLSSIAIEWSILDYFGDISHLLWSGEKLQGMGGSTHIIDIFSRLDPKYIMSRFRSSGFEFMFVATEDGELKLCPKMRTGHNLREQLLRLAAGRKVFVGGNFTFALNGDLHIKFASNDYMGNNFAPGARGSSFILSGSLSQFVRGIFRTQANYRVEDLKSQIDEIFEDNPGFESFRQQAYDDAQAEEDFIEDMLNRVGMSGRARPNTQVAWDQAVGLPLSYKEWMTALKINSATAKFADIRIKWAHYVFGTTPQTKMDDIRKVYRKLSMRFHPDKPENRDKEEVFKAVAEAWEVIHPKRQK